MKLVNTQQTSAESPSTATEQVLPIGQSTQTKQFSHDYCHTSCVNLGAEEVSRHVHGVARLASILALHLLNHRLKNPDCAAYMLVSLLLKTTLISSLATRKYAIMTIMNLRTDKLLGGFVLILEKIEKIILAPDCSRMIVVEINLVRILDCDGVLRGTGYY